MIQGRGRNGMFNVARWGALTFPEYKEKVEVYVYIESERSGKSSPISLTGPREEVKKVLQDLLNQIKDQEEQVALETTPTGDVIHAQT